MPDYTPPSSGGGGGAPTGSAGGDLGGTYPNPTVNTPTLDAIQASAYVPYAGAVATAWGGTALRPNFYPIVPPAGTRRFALTGIQIYVSTLLAAATAGAAIYSVVYSGAQTLTATKVVDIGSATTFDCSTTGKKEADVTGAPVTLDFTTTQYLFGFVPSSAVTLKFFTQTNAVTDGLVGAFKWTSTTFTDATGTSFPSSFTQTSIGPLVNTVDTLVPATLLTAAGKNLFSAA